ncbi:uncharacterized protein LOC142488119 [Ascaphus truei]|uniref:uncharacterized protein LOC142488119 n=1 Tax=Ascaphus truei TaxID=8439 RepID=UPI003F5A685F
MKQRFLKRGYSNAIVRRAYRRAKTTPRHQLLQEKVPKDQSKLIQVIGTYNSKWQNITSIFKKHWHILTVDPVLQQVLKPYPSITSRCPDNLRDFLTHSHYDEPMNTTWLPGPLEDNEGDQIAEPVAAELPLEPPSPVMLSTVPPAKENHSLQTAELSRQGKHNPVNTEKAERTDHDYVETERRIVAPEGHVSPETEQVSSPGSASSTHLEEHDEEDYDDDDDDDAAAIDTQIQASDHEEVPIETVLPPNRPANTTYDAIVASEGKIVEAENRRHSDLMTVLERMIALQEETVSQLAHLHRVFIEVPKQLQKINTSFEALVVQQTQANYLRMTNVPQFNLNTSQAGSVHAGQFSPHASDIHSPGPNVTGQVADIAVQVPDDILPLPSVQIQQLTPTKEATKRKHKQLLLTSFWSKTTKDTHETDQPSLVQCLPTCSHVSVGTSPVGESLATSPVGESLPKSPITL